MKRLLNVSGVVLSLVTLAALGGSAIAYFSSSGNGTAAAAVTSQTVPTLTATPESGGKVKLSWTASTPGGSAVTYYVERDGGDPAGTCPTKAAPTAVLTCNDNPVSIGSHTYQVTAIYKSWTAKSSTVTANVTVGVATKFSLTAATATPTAGAEDALTIVAQDEKGSQVTTYTGSKSLVFSGASASPAGNNPTVSNGSGTAVAFGSSTAITFTEGKAVVSTTKNGQMKIYKAGEASINVAEGSLTDPTPLVVTVAPAGATKFTLTAATATPTAGVEDNLTITALDTYGNTATGYTGSHGLIYSITSTANSPNGTAPTVANSSGTEIPLGTSTPVVFTAGVATSSGGANGAITLYRAGSVTALKATEGSITNATSPTITVAPAAAASLSMGASTLTPVAGASVTLTLTALDAYGNTATSYSGSKSLVFSGAVASPAGTVPTVTNQSGTAVNFGTATPQTFVNGVKTMTLKLYNAAAASISATEGTFTTNSLATTTSVTTASRVAFLNLTASAGTVGSPCFFTCAVTGVGFNGTVKANLQVTDAYGNQISNYGASKTATVTANGGAVTNGSMTFPEAGAAVTPTQFTFTYPSSGTTTYTITAASTGLTSATATVAK